MSHRRTRPALARPFLAAAALAFLVTSPAAAQRRTTHGSTDADSVAFIVNRVPLGYARATLRTEDRRVALLLNDTTVVLQLTDRGMDDLFKDDTTSHGPVGAIFVRMLKAGLSGLMDHGIAYPISKLRHAYADGGRLVLEAFDGTHLFESTNYNGHHPMQEFVPAEAERFAAAVQRAIAARR